MSTIRMFVNGQAMKGGSLHHAMERASLVGVFETAPAYRFFAFPGDFPGILPVTESGVSVIGEVYEMSYADLRDELLPGEPAELELSAIELADGTGCLSMIVREGMESAEGVTDISVLGSWRAHLAQREGRPA